MCLNETTGNLREVFGNRNAGNTVLVRGLDETRPVSRLTADLVAQRTKYRAMTRI